MSVLLPGSRDWLVHRALDLKGQFALRCILRKLRRDADCMLAVLWITDVAQPELLEYAGEPALIPAPFPILESSLASVSVRTRHGDGHLLLGTHVRIGRGMPVLAVGMVDHGISLPGGLALIEDAVEKLEEALVTSVSKAL